MRVSRAPTLSASLHSFKSGVRSLFDPTAPARQTVKSMSRRKCMIVAFAVLFAIIILLLQRHAAPAVTAADGRRLKIEKITYGTQHSFTLGKPWVRVLKPLLGARWAARRGCVEMRFTNGPPALMVWTRWTGISSTNPLPVEATILDEHGSESEVMLARWNQTDWWAHTNRFDSTSYVAWMFPHATGGSRALRLRVYGRDKHYGQNQVAEISLNP